MLNRRILIAVAGAAAAIPAAAQKPSPPKPSPSKPPAADESFASFVAGVKAEARKAGIRQATLDRAFAGVKPNQRVIELDRRQPEATWTWERYRSSVIGEARIARGREMLGRHRALLDAVTQHFRVAPGVIMGIWGLESNYGQSAGNFNVIEAVATLAWEGRRAAFFRSELMDALRILDSGDVPAERMVGSYAGAMGQPQFMPDSFLRFAYDWTGNGKRDIWTDTGDVFASIANYLAKSGWGERIPWGEQIGLPQGFDAALAGRDNRKRLAEWAAMGVRGRASLPPDTQAAVLLPGGAGGDAFLVYFPSFLAIRRYNPSDFYCISVGLIGDAVMG